MQTILVWLLCFNTPLFAETHKNAGRPSGPSERLVKVDDNATVIAKVLKVICDPRELLEYLKQVLIEDERKETEHLDNFLRKRFRFDKEKLTGESLSQLSEQAASGTEQIRLRFNERWNNIANDLKQNKHSAVKALGAAIRPHVESVNKEYISMRDHYKGTTQFTGIGCAACNVGYAVLSKSLREHSLHRGAKRRKEDCPEKEEKPKPAENDDAASGILQDLRHSIAPMMSQKEKISALVNKLGALERAGKIDPLLRWSESINNDPSKREERNAVMRDLGLTSNLLLPSAIKNNRWSKGVTVDYSALDGGPRRNSGSDSFLENIKAKLQGPSLKANHVLLNLTGACFYCDAALWGQLRFP